MRRSALVLASVSALALPSSLGGAPELRWRASDVGDAAPPAWTADDSAALDRRIEELEQRLLAHQARVAFWDELRARHASVTAVACENLAEHAAAMRANESHHQLRLADQRRRRGATASEGDAEGVQ